MFTLSLLVLFHMACSFTADMKYFYSNGGLLDFDEDDPFVESVSKPEEISPMELKRLKERRYSRQAGRVNQNETTFVENLGTALPTVGHEKIALNAVFDDVKKIEETVLKGSGPQDLKNLYVSFGTKNPFHSSKKYFGESDLIRSTSLVNSKANFNVIVTPYTKSDWEPNFLRAVID